MLKHLMSAIEQIKGGDYKITTLKNGGETIHQTQRNAIGATLRGALGADLSEIFPIADSAEAVIAYITADGIVLEIPNQSIKDKSASPDGSGAISVEFSIKVKSLDYNAANESEAYQVTLAEKAAEAQKKAEAKAKKMAKDAEVRAAKKKKEGE